MEVITRFCAANVQKGLLIKNMLHVQSFATITGIKPIVNHAAILQVGLPPTKCLSMMHRAPTQKRVNPESPKNDETPFYHEQSLPHFRESLPKSKEEKQTHFRETYKKHEEAMKDLHEKSKDSLGSAPAVKADEALHPDVQEALGMHEGGYRLPHPIWNNEELESVGITHRPPETRTDKFAYFCVMMLRRGFDLFSGYTWGMYRGTLDEKQWLKRIIFLETVAGVPGMVGAMVRHLVSLRRMKRDHGWIHTLLEEAENERMHLMTAMRVANPGIIMRTTIVLAQGVFVPTFSIAYLISPRFCHRFVGYLEEEAVKTYTKCLQAIDEGELKMWCRMKAPEIAVEYWKLPADAMMRDVILAIRADEAHHRAVNHTLSSKNCDEKNPYKPGE